jgi:hypothetical protein
MGKHTKPRRNKTTKQYGCQRCGKQMTLIGSGRPIKYCSTKCRYNTVYKPTQRIKAKGTTMSRGKEIVLKDKLLRGECILHPAYHQGRRKFVTLENHRMFAYDHIDRSIKQGTIAKLVDSSPQKLETELLKCQLVCHNCHAMKTYEDKDWHRHGKELSEQPGLFDNE